MLKTKGERKIREDFIRGFVNQLVRNSYTPSKEEYKKPSKSKILKNLKGPYLPSIKRPRLQMPPITHQLPSQGGEPQIINIQSLPPLKPSPPQKGQKPQSINLGKITSFLLDPAVISVECPGPGKNLHVNRGGSIQTASATLTESEIETLMNEISDKTRIPLSPGLFKAAVQDLLITAVLSEFVGTRFIIQKRTPFQKY